MAQDLGTIYYEVDAKVDAFLTTSKQVDKQIEKTEKGLSDVAKAAGVYIDSSGRMREANGRFVTSARKVELGLDGIDSSASRLSSKLTPLAAAIAGVITVQTLATWGKMAEQFTLFQARITRLSADVETARSTYQSLLAIASQTGSSMGDSVRLWESLTSTLKSLGATNAQVLQLTSTLQKIGTIGGSSAEETANALRQLSQGLAAGTLRAEEFNSVVENMPELARQLATGFGMSMGELRQAMIDGQITAEKLFEVLLGRTQEVDREFAKLPRTVSQAANAVVTQFGAALSRIDQMVGASQKLAKVLDGIARGVQITFNPSDQQKFAELIQQRATAEQQYQTQLKAGLNVTAANTKARLEAINAEIKAMQDRRVEQIKAESGGTGGASKPAATTTADGQKVLDALAQQNQQLRAQGVERAKIIALQKLGASATQQEKDAAVALAVENYNMQEAEKQRQKDAQAGIASRRKAESEAAREKRKEEAEQRRADEQAKRGTEQNIQVFARLGAELGSVGKSARELAQDQATLALNKYATPEQVQAVRDVAAALYDAKYAQQQLAQADPVAAAGVNYTEQLVALQELNAQKLLSDQQYLELKNAAETEYDARRLAAQEQIFAAQSRGNAFLMDSLNALQGTSTQVFAGLITGAMSGADAVRALANTIFNQAISAIVEWGFAQVKAVIMGQTAQAAATAAGVAQGAALATAYGPAAIAASIASFGAAPAAGAAAMATAVPTMSALLAIGGRKNGGPVAAGGMYRVNEGGAPEIFTGGNGQQYLMPNKRGQVVSNADATAGGSAVTVNVYNQSAKSQVRTETREDETGKFVSVFVEDMDSGGPMFQALSGVSNVTRVGQ